MEKSVIGFERVDHLISIASGKITPDLFITTDDILVVRYSDYVKSQLHLNMTSQLFERSSMLYKAAYDFIEGDYSLEGEAEKVLELFYHDMINFLLHNEANVKIECVTDINFTHKYVRYYNYTRQYEHLQQLCSKHFESFDDASKYVQENKSISYVLDYMQNVQDIERRLDSFCAISLITNYKAGIIPQWEVYNDIRN